MLKIYMPFIGGAFRNFSAHTMKVVDPRLFDWNVWFLDFPPTHAFTTMSYISIGKTWRNNPMARSVMRRLLRNDNLWQAWHVSMKLEQTL